ncbi:MAG: S8 family peptidase [Planctomycetaceae bacterium]|jgi:subtilisin family serine protease
MATRHNPRPNRSHRELPQSTLPEFIPGKLLLKIRPEVLRGQAANPHTVLASGGLAPASASLHESLRYLLDNAGLKPDSITSLFVAQQPEQGIGQLSRAPMALATTAREASAADDSLRGISLLHVDHRKLTPTLLKKLRQDDRFEYVEQAPARWLTAARPSAAPAIDAEWNAQWGLRAIRWFQASIPNAESIGVAVLDTGLDLNHPDFANVPIDYETFQFTKSDQFGHGTHVTGIIGALPNNDAGSAGVCRCHLHVFKVFGDEMLAGRPVVDPEAYNAALGACLVNDKIRVLNLSLAGTASSETEKRVFQALQKRGKLVVAAMGNEFTRGNPVEYPAAYDGIVAVGAIDAAGHRAEFSNTGPHISLVAPGSSILSTLPTQSNAARAKTNYAAWDGTSMATPHVAAAAALLFAKSPNLSGSQARKKLLAGTRRLTTMPKKGHSPEFGSGLLDLAKLLQ